MLPSTMRQDARCSTLPSTSGRVTPAPLAPLHCHPKQQRTGSSLHRKVCGSAPHPLLPSKNTVRLPPVAAGRSSVSNSLVGVLKDEMKYARESYRRPEQLLEAPPNDFDLEDEPGKNSFYLMRSFKDEEIVIEVSLGNEALDGEDEDEEDDSPVTEEGEGLAGITFEVQVAKGSQALMFECESNGEYLVIQRIALEQAGGSNDDDDEEDLSGGDNYLGPEFEDLDDTLQQAFVDYLEERGVNAELGEYIRLYVEDKTSVEYQAWLQRVRDFIAS